MHIYIYTAITRFQQAKRQIKLPKRFLCRRVIKSLCHVRRCLTNNINIVFVTIILSTRKSKYYNIHLYNNNRQIFSLKFVCIIMSSFHATLNVKLKHQSE